MGRIFALMNSACQRSELLAGMASERRELEIQELVMSRRPSLYWRKKWSFFASYSERPSSSRSIRNCAHS